MKKLKLGILDQSLVHHGISASDAINQTIETVKLAEMHGYNRFWVSEHHNSSFIAGSSPEIQPAGPLTSRYRPSAGGRSDRVL